MDYLQTLARWQEVKLAIKHLQEEERALRDGLFSGTFKDPTEGVNKHKLADGRELKGTYKINRTPIQELVHELPARLKNKVFKRTYALIVGEFKKLNDEDRHEVSAALVEKPGLPTLEIKEAKKDPADVTP